MSKYIISSTTEGTQENPFQLNKGTNYDKVTNIDLNGCYAKFADGMIESMTALTEIKGCNGSNINVLPDTKNVSTWNINLSDLTDGSGMFQENENLTSFNGDLSSLVDGNNMFNYCWRLTSFTTTNLDSLENGSDMFNTTSVGNISLNLPKLTNGDRMFYDCESIEVLNLNAPLLVSANQINAMNPILNNLTLIVNETFADKYNDINSWTNYLGLPVDSDTDEPKMTFTKTTLESGLIKLEFKI